MHVEYPERSWWMILLLHIGIRLRFFFESWFFLKPFIIKDFSDYPSPWRPKNSPTIGYWPTLGFKLLWFISANLRQARIITGLALLFRIFHILGWFHRKLQSYVLNDLKKRYPNKEELKKFHDIPLPTWDWKTGDPEEFYEKFVKHPHPVLLKGFMKDTRIIKECAFDELLKKYGDETVLLTSKEMDGYAGKLKEVNNPNVYLHNSEILFKKYKVFFELLESYKLEPYTHMKAAYSQIFMGKYGTGSGLHSASNFNLFYMVCGNKKWYFIDPNDMCFQYPIFGPGLVANISLIWHPDHYEQESFPLMEYCPYYSAVVEEGDVLFNPPWWFHSIKNVSEKTFAIASRWHTNGIAGHQLMTTEENYNINRLSSLMFFIGWYSIPFMQGILKEPSPSYDEHLTSREKNNYTYGHNQYKLAFKPGLTKMGHRFTF
jgi:hypothetical protein